MDPSKLFLTANPTPRSLISPDGFPCQKKVKFLSLMEPESGSLVSWGATMSICSLVSSRSMTAVLRTSVTSCKSSKKPGVIVLTFQVPNFRTGDFFFLLPGAQLSIRLSAFFLNPTHPVRLADRGEVAPNWLGAAQLEAGGSHLLRYDDLSHRRKQPLASSSTPNEHETYNR